MKIKEKRENDKNWIYFVDLPIISLAKCNI